MKQRRKFFMSYSDGEWEPAGRRIAKEASATGEFDGVFSYGRSDVSTFVRNSKAFTVQRGAGLWSWKPDIILKALKQIEYGDILLYCDAGCTIYPGRAWNKIWHQMDGRDLFVQRIYQKMECWSRAELVKEFSDISFQGLFQFMATVIILVKSNFTVGLVSEWRRYMVERPELFFDVSPDERVKQQACFIESRHDQSVFSALVYRALKQPAIRKKILDKWESCENFDLISPQPIRATRWRGEQPFVSPLWMKSQAILRRLVKDFVYRPFVASPVQWFAERKNGFRF